MARKELIQLRCSQPEKHRWQQEAQKHGMELSPWIRLMLDKASTGGAPAQKPELFPEPANEPWGDPK